MEIHKPKPVRSWRELLTEIGIIVLSVCIALAAEQSVEWWHWQGEVSAARTALVAEIAANNRDFAMAVAAAPCMDRQIHEAEEILAAIGAGKSPSSFTAFHHNFGYLLSDSEWQSERSSQVLTHFPRGELASLSRYYMQVPDFKAWLGPITQTWVNLSILRHPPAKLEPDTIARLRTDIDSARYMQSIVLLNSLRMLNVSDRLGLPRPAPQADRVARYCAADDEQLIGTATQATRRPGGLTRP
jgi:hypothetical protein